MILDYLKSTRQMQGVSNAGRMGRVFSIAKLGRAAFHRRPDV
jgi:hypothetical protein